MSKKNKVAAIQAVKYVGEPTTFKDLTPGDLFVQVPRLNANLPVNVKLDAMHATVDIDPNNYGKPVNHIAPDTQVFRVVREVINVD